MDNAYHDFQGPNLGYVLELYERYRQDPQSVDPATRQFFEHWQPPGEAPAPVAVSGVDAGTVAAVVNLANAIRTFGHLAAHLDPLGSPPPGDPWHELEYYGLSEADLAGLPASVVAGPLAEDSQSALETIHKLRQVYTARIGYEYGHIQIPEERDWLRHAAECGRFRPPQNPIDRVALLHRLIVVEAFEQFLHRIFPGKTRFSIEGVDMLVPMLDELISDAAQAGICTVTIGMAHRGRLNVLAHILGKPYAKILAEFKDPLTYFPTRDELGWTGDVKYHKGAYHAVQAEEEIKLIVSLPPNPSHLEHVDPVVEGMARAAGSVTNRPGEPQFFPKACLPVLIHGDASFMGQGIVAENLNFSRIEGYSTGGTVHIIANNQLGYTTLPEESRSTLYASDLAKGFEIPIIHVNADDPSSCIEAIRTAFAYREAFNKDFLIDLIGYRRYGHNEGDEPGFTQPRMYATIAAHPSVRTLWARSLAEEGEIEPDGDQALFQQQMDQLQEVLARLEPEEDIKEPELQPPPRGAARKVQTGVPLDVLRELNQSLLQLPEGFHLHRKIDRAMQRRLAIFEDPDEPSVDWAAAEELALASILAEGIPIRFTGEDVERGTFSQRHAVFHDVETGDTYTPLQALPQAKASFQIYNSPLSENAALGFEFGYNITNPGELVLWEAQYGDFINTAQPIIDEFILSGRAKWEQTPSLVLLLPHGYEGQGPDHSSGRMERFLQMAAGTNLRLANCTTAAQYFHLLRRQAALLKTDPLPLIVFTPKSLLRHPLVASPPRQLAEGVWQPVIDDPLASQEPDRVERLILCSGKIYIDLIAAGHRQEVGSRLAIVRLEQLYRFPEPELAPILEAYRNASEIIWVQEEPQNMGAWSFVYPRLQDMVGPDTGVGYIGREASASPAEGSGSLHADRQREIVEMALNLESIRVKEG